MYRLWYDDWSRQIPRRYLAPTELVSTNPRRIFPYGTLRIFVVYPPTLFEQKYPRETYLILAPSQEAALKMVPDMYPPEIELAIQLFANLTMAVARLLDIGSEGGILQSRLVFLGFPKSTDLVWGIITREQAKRRPYRSLWDW